jgi:hypothetical protein
MRFAALMNISVRTPMPKANFFRSKDLKCPCGRLSDGWIAVFLATR